MSDDERPKTRGDCVGGCRPCPWVGCRYHLFFDVRPTLSPPNGRDETDKIAEFLQRMPQTCALDVADTGDHTLEEIGGLLGVTREWTRQIAEAAMRSVRSHNDREDFDG